MISGLVLKYLNGECFVIRRGYETTLPVSSSFCLTVPSEDIRHIPFEDLLKQRIDLPVFRLSDGTVSKNIHQTFRKFVTDAGLITCPRTNQNRTLYSLRHPYATFALLNDGMDIHALAIQMGTSIGMIYAASCQLLLRK
jgi:hypothetical protein